MTSQTCASTDKRNYGIDLMRMVGMFMVVILHVLGQGGVLAMTAGLKNHIAWLLETGAYCAVDCFAIISGFVSYTDKEKTYSYSKFFGFWLQVITYNFGITLIAFLVKPAIVGEVKIVIKSLLPVATEAYWYVSAYAGLFFIIPWLNKLMRSCSKKEATSLITVILFIFVGYVTFANKVGDCFKLSNGYSFVWLTILYLIGAWMKKCDIPSRLNSLHLFCGSVICILFSWLGHEFIMVSIFHLLVNYTSFTIVFVASSFVAIFSKLKFGAYSSKLIACFAPAAFGVYLIHTQPLVWNHFFSNRFAWISNYPAYLLPALVLGMASLVFIICLLVEKLRIILFRLLRINQFEIYAENKLHFFVAKCKHQIANCLCQRRI